MVSLYITRIQVAPKVKNLLEYFLDIRYAVKHAKTILITILQTFEIFSGYVTIFHDKCKHIKTSMI